MLYIALALNKLNIVKNSKERNLVFIGINKLGSLRCLIVKT
jgi:hypothetical protein